jgi:hypothetical protein
MAENAVRKVLQGAYCGRRAKPADDGAGIRWVSAEDIDDIDFAWKHDRNLVRTALADGD